MGFRPFPVVALLLLFISPGVSSPNCHRRVISINPPTIFDPLPFAFKHIAVDTRNSVACIAGQTAVDVTGSVVGSTLEDQLVAVEKNLKLAMDAVGAGVDDILQMMTFVKDFDQEKDLPILAGTFQRLGSPVNPLVSTPSLAFSELLVEIQVTVAVPNEVVQKLIGSCPTRYGSYGYKGYSGHAYAIDGEAEVIPMTEDIEQKEDVLQ